MPILSDIPITPAPKPKKVTTKVTARQMLEQSIVTPKALQQELMGEDVGVDKLAVYLSSIIRFDIADRIVDASVNRTMDASSTLTVTINDYDRAVLTSGYLYNKLDVQVDGMWFRLSGVDKQGDQLTLTFEDRMIAVLRGYNSWKVAKRSTTTRAEFILNLINEVKEFKIPYVIPELHTPQLLETYSGDPKGADAVLYKRKGMPADASVQAPAWYKGTAVGKKLTALTGQNDVPLTKEQITNASTILAMGEQASASHPIKVSAIMAAIVESNLQNVTATGDGYFNQVLQLMSIAETQATLEFLNAWAHREGVIQSIDSYNLLGTTLKWGDSYGTNDPQVQHYSSASDGINAHASMLNQSNFNLIKAALATGDPNSMRNDVPTQQQFHSWSGGGYIWPSDGEATTPVIATADNGSNPIPSTRAKSVKKSVSGPLGIFGQTQGSATDRTNVEAAARIYYNHAKTYYKNNPKSQPEDIAQGVLQSDHPTAYKQYQDSALKILHVYGLPGGINAEIAGADANGQYQNLGAGGEFYFYRGNIENRLGQKIRRPENSWTCIVRLAGDVNWKAFFVGDTFYYISEDDLIKQQPALIMTEFTEGIREVDGNFYEHKDSASLTITADVGKWMVPPGRLVVVQEMGPWDGRWLVSEFDRSLFDTTATINLVREQPGLPEPNPKGGNKSDINPTWVPKPGSPKAGVDNPGSASVVGGTPETPKVKGDRIALAKELLTLYGHGWTDYNTGYQQIQDTALGKTLYSKEIGKSVNLDPRIIAVIIYLISEKGFDIGTYAWCTDHHTVDGVTGHNGGHAVDIEYINGLHINNSSQQCFNNVLAVDKVLDNIQGYLYPRQIITAGYGNVRNMQLTAYSRPQPADQYYGTGTMAVHCNHIHVGY